MTYSTEQEEFWEGEFGNRYTDRNRGQNLIASNIAFFSKVLKNTEGIHKLLELGSNVGLNLIALNKLLPKVKMSAVEINKKAASELKKNLPEVNLHVTSILDFNSRETWDFVFTKGVLIHINPAKLPMIYELIYQSSSRYILLAEYYNPKPIEVTYRGHSEKLFKRDFAGEMLGKYSKLTLVDYGFIYHRDPNFPQDDMNWFLLGKK